MNNRISKRALIKFWAYNICELRITAKVYSRFWFEYWTFLKTINPHRLVQVPTVKYRFLVISCMQTLFFQAFNNKVSFVAFHFFSAYFPCVVLCLFVVRMLSSLVTRQFDFSELWLYTMPGPGLAFLMSACVYSCMQRGYVAVSINPSPGWETQMSVAVRMRERNETMPRVGMGHFWSYVKKGG